MAQKEKLAMQATRSNKVTKDPYAITIVLATGGSGGTLIEHHPAIDADIFIVADAADALTNMPDDVFTIVLSDDETIGTLAAKVKDHKFDKAAEILLRQNTHLRQGFAQRPVLCQMAVNVRNRDIMRTLREVKDEALILTDANLSYVELLVDNSNSGGTGSAAGYLLANMLVEILVKETNCTVDVRNLRIGDKTYLSLGNFVQFNHSAGLIRDLAWVLGVKQDKRVTISLNIAELPPTKDNKQQRDMYMLAVSQALLAQETKVALAIAAPNLHQNLNLGRLSTTHAKFWLPGDSINVPGCAALLALSPLEGMVKSTEKEGSTMMVRVAVQPQADVVHQHSSVISFARHIGQPRPANVYDMLVSVMKPAKGTVFLKHDKSAEQALDGILAAAKPRTLERYREYMRLLRTISETLKAEEVTQDKTMKTKKAEFEKNLEAAKKIVDARWRKLMPWNPAKAKMELEKALPQLEKSENAYNEEEWKLQSLKQAIERVKGELTTFEDEIKKMLEWAQKIADEEGAMADVFVSNGLDFAFASLIKAVRKQSFEQFRLAIPAVASAVSAKGLALIVGAENESSISIIHAIMEKEPTKESPYPGGLVRKDNEYRAVLAIPFINDDVFASLQTAAAEEKANFQISRVTRIDGVVAVVMLRVFNILEIGQIWTDQHYATYLELAADDEKTEVTVLKDAPYIEELEAALKVLKCEREK